MRSNLEAMLSCKGFVEVLWSTLPSMLNVTLIFASFVLTLEILGLCAEEKWPVRWLYQLCFTIGGFLMFIVAKMILLPYLWTVWTYFQSFASECADTHDSPLCLLIRARVASGLQRINRMSFSELLQLHNSHAPLLELGTKREVLNSNRLCKRLRKASLPELSFLYDASDIITRNVEQVLSQNPRFVKLQRRWGKIVGAYDWDSFEVHTIDGFQFVLLVLSVFESINEDIRTVILYGVPGLPSLTLPVSSTYADIRSTIVRIAPSFNEFYFVAHGRMITIEDTVIEWGSGHLVLNVHSCRDLPGGSMGGSSDDQRKGRRRSKRINLQELLRSDSSVDEDLDDTISVGISDSDSYEDSESSWNLEKEKKRDQKRRDARKNKGGDRTVRQVSSQNIRNARTNEGGDRTVQEVSVQNNENARI